MSLIRAESPAWNCCLSEAKRRTDVLRTRYRWQYHGFVFQVVLDTSVIVAAARSRLGASFEVLSRVGTGEFDIAISVPLVLEYEDALTRHAEASGLDQADVQDIVDYLCSIAIKQEIFFLWRPTLRDPGDDHVLELAVAAECEAVVTHNLRDFAEAKSFGVKVISPSGFLNQLRGVK